MGWWEGREALGRNTIVLVLILAGLLILVAAIMTDLWIASAY